MDGIQAVHTQKVTWQHEGLRFEGHLARPRDAGPHPGVLVFPTWKGLERFARGEAETLARQGYAALGVDLYGEGRVAADEEEAASLMNELAGDRPLLRARGRAALDALAALPEVDPESLAAVGFCFGGMAALELARSGARLRAAISYHGFLDTPIPAVRGRVQAKILAHHGADDPLLGPHETETFASEMTEAGVDWTLVVYGHTLHGFTNPAADAPERGVQYQPDAARRARQTTADFLANLFGE